MWSGDPPVINYCEEEEEGEVRCGEERVLAGCGPGTREISVSVNY